MAAMLRDLKEHDLEESVSTRLIIYTATLINAGLDMPSAIKAAMLEPLSDDELTIDALSEIVALKI